METFDQVLVGHTEWRHGQGQEGRQAILHLAQHHAYARLYVSSSQVSRAMMNHDSNYNVEEAGMAQMDDSIGELLQHIDDIGRNG